MSVRATSPGPRVLTLAVTTSQTITPPAWAVVADLDMWGAGASGGNGTTGASGTVVTGGGSGAGGGRRRVLGLVLSSLSAPLTIAIGVGGAIPSGTGAPGNAGGDTKITSGNLSLFAGGGGAPSGGQAANQSFGGAGGSSLQTGANATTSAPGKTFSTDYSGGVGTYPAAVPGLSCGAGGSGSSGGNAVSAAGRAAIDGGPGGGSGGGVNSSSAFTTGGASSLATVLGGQTAGANGGAVPTTAIFPGMDPISGAGGAGGDATHAGGNGSVGYGPGAGGGGGGSTLTGQAFGLGGKGTDGVVYITFRG